MRVLWILASLSTPDSPAEKLSLEHYLSQVEGGNFSTQAAQKTAEGSEAKKLEGELIFAPAVFAFAQTGSDKKPSFFLPYQSLDSTNYSLGISQNLRFGVKAQLSYGANDFDYVSFKPHYFEASPKLEATWSLLRNFGGEEFAASEKAAAEAARLAYYSSAFEMKMTRAEAELAYYRLAMARELKQIGISSLERSQKLYDWSKRRSSLQLQDQSDFFQAQANLDTKKLSLQQAIEQEKSAARVFNKTRGMVSDEVSEEVELPNFDRLRVGQKQEPREDLKSAEANAAMAAANAEAGKQRNKPTLELFGSYALNSNQESNMGDALSGSFKTNRPTSLIGVRFTASLGDGKKIREGYALDREAAELRLENKRREQEIEWQDLNQKFVDAQKRLSLAVRLEDIQRQKVLHERKRLASGRTTTYQELLFEQDFSLAQIQRMQTQLEMLEAHARIQTYTGEKP